MRLIAALGLLVLTALPAAAEPDLDAFARKFFGRPLGSGVNHVCFSRVYDAAHLARHPRQDVTDMALLARLEGVEPSYYSLTLGLRLRGSKELHTARADCRSQGVHGDAAILCAVTCDAGRVDITLKDNGSVYLTFPNNAAIWTPSEADDPKAKGPKLGADDLIFRLDRSPGAPCAALADEDERDAVAKQK